MGNIDPLKGGGLSGRSGELVYYVTKDGKQHFRSYVKPGNPGTPAQTANRMKFRLVNKSLGPLYPYLQRGYPDVDKIFYRMVAFAMREAVEGEYPHFRFNYSKIQRTRGALPTPLNASVAYQPATREARFSWESPADTLSHHGSPNDIVQIIAHHSDRYAEVRTLHAGTRRSGSFTYLLPDHWKTEQTHYWLYLLSYDMQEQSDSLYLHETSG